MLFQNLKNIWIWFECIDFLSTFLYCIVGKETKMRSNIENCIIFFYIAFRD
jgi:hypothetical protein